MKQVHKLHKSIYIAALSTALTICAPPPTDAACQGSRAREGVCDDQINIGSSVVLTGPLADWGNSIARRGPRAYFNMINERGGIHGRKINYIIYNDSYRPERALANVKKLIQKDRVLCILLQTGTITTRVSYKYVTEEKNVPFMFPASGSHFWTSPLKPRVFPLSPSFSMQTYILIDYLVLTRGYKKIGIFYQDGPFGHEILIPAIQRLKDHGLKPAGQEKLKTNEFEVGGQLLKLRREGAEAVVLAVPYNFAFRFIREARKVDWKVQMGGISLTGLQALLTMARDAAVGYVNVMTVPQARYATGPAMEEYRSWLGKEFSDAAFNSSSLTGWWAAKLLTEILRRSGRDLSRDNMIKAAENIRGYETGITGPVSFYPHDHSGTTAGFIAVAVPTEGGPPRFVPLGSGPAEGPAASPLWISSWGKSVEEVKPLFNSFKKFTDK